MTPRAIVGYLKLFRFPLVFTAIADSAAGYLLVAGRTAQASVLGLLAAASAGLYFLGMALNDVADRERDKTLAPNRVIPSGRVSLRGAVTASTLSALLSGGAVVLNAGSPPLRFAAWGGTLLAILAYDLFLKVPPVMGLVRAGNFLLGVFSAPAPAATYRSFLYLALVPFAYVTALTFVSTLEEKTLKRPVLMGGAFVMAAAAITPEYLEPILFQREVALFSWILSGILIGAIFARTASARDRKGVMLLVRDGVGGIILLDAAILLSARQVLAGWAVAALVVPAAFFISLFKRLA